MTQSQRQSLAARITAKAFEEFDPISFINFKEVESAVSESDLNEIKNECRNFFEIFIEKVEQNFDPQLTLTQEIN